MSFPYQSWYLGGHNPSKMVETQFINCVGASILGGGLLDEVGIKYLHADLPAHSVTVLITSDEKVYWQDFTPGITLWNYKEITNKDLTGTGLDGKPLTIADIVALANNPSDKGLHLEINKWWYNLNMGKIKKISYRYLNLFNPEIGLQGHILSNTGKVLRALGRKEEAIEAYRQAIAIIPEDASLYNGLGNALFDLDRKEEAIETFRKFVSLWKGDQSWIDRANGIIEELERE